ncbi:MAG: hypothetical protein HYX32_10010 [Actinobacteria bacterium]|nr:hypothetical protein [Actinomycetota bacterium]
MDDSDDSGADDARDTRGGDGKRRSRHRAKPPSTGRPAAKPPPAAVRKRSDSPKDTAPPRKWWEQPWLWLAMIVGVVGSSLAVSFAVNTDPQDIAPVSDTAAFCAAARGYRDATATVSIGVDTSQPDFDRLQQAFAAVQRAAPPEIQPTADAAAATLAETIQSMESLRSEPDGLVKLQKADERLSSLGRRTERSTDRFVRYVSRACGFEFAATEAPPPTAPSPAAPSPTAPSPTAPPTSQPVPLAPGLQTVPVAPPTGDASSPESSPDSPLPSSPGSPLDTSPR